MWALPGSRPAAGSTLLGPLPQRSAKQRQAHACHTRVKKFRALRRIPVASLRHVGVHGLRCRQCASHAPGRSAGSGSDQVVCLSTNSSHGPVPKASRSPSGLQRPCCRPERAASSSRGCLFHVSESLGARFSTHRSSRHAGPPGCCAGVVLGSCKREGGGWQSPPLARDRAQHTDASPSSSPATGARACRAFPP